MIESFGCVVEVVMEHVKHAWWTKLHEATTTMGLDKGDASQDGAVTDIPEGIRTHPYKRDLFPTLEVLLIWTNSAGIAKGHCLSSTTFPDAPGDADVDRIFGEIEPFFAKRWLTVQLKLAAPIRGEFEALEEGADASPHDDHVGAGAVVTVLACHALGFAREKAEGVAHVAECRPMTFQGTSDTSGLAKICFLPADVNKLQVSETDTFHGFECMIPKASINTPDKGPTVVPIELTPKALAGLIVHTFAMPAKMPEADDGIIDWASEERAVLEEATVEVLPMKDGAASIAAKPMGGGAYELSGLPEGCVTLTVTCPGFAAEERTVMLLVGGNEFYVPLNKDA